MLQAFRKVIAAAHRVAEGASEAGIAAVLLAALAASAFAWPHFADKAQAAYVLQAIAFCYALLALWAVTTNKLLSMVAMAGAVLQGVTVACGSFFEALSSQEVGVCDEGTGRPVSVVLAVAAVVVAAAFRRGMKK
jgi:hypothetical protein